MPKNPGFNPYANQKDAPMVDLKYRNGWIARSVDPGKRRWVPWPDGESPGDIVEDQESDASTPRT